MKHVFGLEHPKAEKQLRLWCLCLSVCTLFNFSEANDIFTSMVWFALLALAEPECTLHCIAGFYPTDSTTNVN